MSRSLLPTCVCLLVLLVASVSDAQSPTPDQPNKSVTVYPIALSTDRGIPESLPVRLAEVVGTLLERAGMTEIEIAEQPFDIPEGKPLKDIAKAFGKYVANDAPATSHAILGEIATDASGISQIRIVVVDRDGKLLFSEDADRETFAQSKVPPRDPMTACVFLASRLAKVWDLADPLREDAPQGKMAQRMAARSGLPPKAQLEAIKVRLATFKSEPAPRTVTVYPIHLWQGWDSDQAQELAAGLQAGGLFETKVATDTPPWNVKGDPNEQEVLWDTARAFREYLRVTPPQTEYALLADYGLAPSGEGERAANHVHLVLCTAAGDWVLVDFQNSHHADFQQIDPTSTAQCTRLALTRLSRLLDAAE